MTIATEGTSAGIDRDSRFFSTFHSYAGQYLVTLSHGLPVCLNRLANIAMIF